MCHETRTHHGCGCHHSHSCDCGGLFHFARRFCTKEEKIACFEQYLGSLQAEARAVEERIAELKENR
jgi:hypothetical protein